MLLEARNLSKAFGGVKAVDDISWSLETGEMHCIIGPNGAGKSTFFQLLIGRQRPDSGAILLESKDITRTHAFERARLGMAVKPQTLGVFGELTVEHNLRLCLQRAAARDQLEQALATELEQLRLAGKRRFLARELSHGEKQWLALGMAMATKPKLLLLDEPTAGMSPSETDQTVMLIKTMSSAGTAVLVVEHDMAFVRSLAVATTVFDDGKIFASGTLRDIEQNQDVRRLYLGKRGAMKLRH